MNLQIIIYIDYIIYILYIDSYPLKNRAVEEGEFVPIEDIFMTILKKREEENISENILLIAKSTTREKNKEALEKLIENFPGKNFYLMEVPYLKRPLKKKELDKERTRRTEQKRNQSDFHFQQFFILLGGAISNNALMVTSDSFAKLFPNAKHSDDNKLSETTVYDRFSSTR